MSETGSADGLQGRVVREPRPDTLVELACWVNCWGNLFHQKEGPAFKEGYRQAISDVGDHLRRLVPDWLDAWPAWNEKRGTPIPKEVT